ncbi:MAG TPA: PhzF family phenazine biosynthesis protein [Candidatus Thermoplasmatota archaeon]|nr:PhzF family phenazine biosynthesis protein [Candidatus Thermoplasmatota archaeon]
MRLLEAYKVDAFTTTPYTGNIAGVVPKAEGLSDAQMQRIAREMNVSETAFVLPATTPGAQIRLRYFTPATEIRLCGHATIASFHLLVEKGMLKAPAQVKLQTNVGVLEVDVRADGEAFMSSDSLVVEPAPFTRAECAALLGLPVDELREPILVIRRTLFVGVSGLKAMEAMRPDLPAIKAEYHRLDGVVPVSFDTPGDALTRIRFFAPGLGIDEDPVTGTAHFALAAYALRAGKIRAPARFVGEQGHECGRPGRVSVEVDGSADAPRVRMGGRAVTVFSGTLVAP